MSTNDAQRQRCIEEAETICRSESDETARNECMRTRREECEDLYPERVTQYAPVSAGEDYRKADNWVKKLFGGTAGFEEGPNEKACKEREKHYVPGQGPSCIANPEIGAYSLAKCVYEKVDECKQVYASAVLDCCRKNFQYQMAASCNEAPPLDPEEPPDSDDRDENCETIADPVKRAQCERRRIQAIADACLQTAEEANVDCLSRVAALCECKRCIKEPEDEDNNDPTQDDPNVAPPDDPSGINFITASGFGYIPRVYGRYAVSGNIIWISEPVTDTITYTKTLDDGTSTEVVEDRSTVSILIGVAAGIQSKLVRMWANDVLIYTRLNDSMSELDFSVFADGAVDLSRLAMMQPTITFVEGTETQGVLTPYRNAIGVDLTPAHRDLSMVLLENIDLAILGTRFPKFLFDISSEPPSTELATVSSTGDATDSFIGVDTNSRLIGVSSPDGVDIVDGSTLEVVRSVNKPNASEAITGYHLLGTQQLAISMSDGKVYFVDLFSDVTTNVSSHPLSQRATSTVIVDDFQSAALLFNANSTGATDIIKVGATAAIVGTIAEKAGYTLVGQSFLQESASLYLIQSFVHNTFASALLRKVLISTDGVIGTTFTGTDTTVQPHYVWGSENTGVSVVGVFKDPQDDTMVWLCANNSQTVISKTTTTGESVWTTRTDYALPSGFGQDIYTNFPAGDFVFVSGGDIIGVDLVEGTVELRQSGVTTLGGMQVFDASRRTLVYVNTGGGVTLSRQRSYAFDRVYLDSVLNQLFTDLKYPTGFIDTSDCSDISFIGTGITTKGTVQAYLNSLFALYAIRMVNDGYKMRLIKNTNLTEAAALTTLDISDVSVSDSADFSGNSTPDGISASFINIDDTGIVTLVQTVYAVEDTTPNSEVTKKLTVPVNDDAESIRQYLEKLLLLETLAKTKIELQLMPRMLSLSVGDLLEYSGSVYSLTANLIAPTNELKVSGTAFDDRLDALVSLAEVTLRYNQRDNEASAPTFARAHVLFTNAITADDTLDSLYDTQIAYAVVEAYTSSIGETTIGFRTEESPTYRSSVVAKSAQVGRLTEIPEERTDIFSQSSDTLSVKFTRPFDDSGLRTVPGVYTDIQEFPTDNLLVVGRELIQFKSWSVSGNEVTFSGLLRGVNGTEAYMGHAVGDVVVLYDAEAFARVEVNPLYTNEQPMASAFVNGSPMAGSVTLRWAQRTDAGAARAWAPNILSITETAQGGGFITLSLELARRRSVYVDHEEEGGNLPDEWNGLGFTSIFELNDYNDLATFETDLRDGGMSFPESFLGTVEIEETPELAPRHFAVAYVRYLPDGSSAIVGHPHLFTVTPGGDTTYET